MKIPEPAQQRGQTGTPPAAASEGPGFVLRDQLTSPAPGHQILGHKRPPVMPRTSVSGLWRIDGGFVARIRIKNALVVAPLQVEPALYMADGTEYRLPPVTVAVAGVAVININDALAKAPPSVLTHLSTFGSASLTYRYSSGGHLVATTALQDSSRSLALVYPFSESGMVQNQPSSADGTWEGVWWKHDAEVQGFLAVSNVTNREAEANIRLVSAAGMLSPPEAINLAAHATQMFSLEGTNDGLGAEGHAGGIRVDYPGDPGTIMVSGGLLNPKEGYSANIPFARGRSSQIGPVTVGSAGIMVGKPDPMMRFPAETTLTPYLVLRNTTTKPLNLNLHINSAAESTPISRPLPEKLAPLATKRVNLPGLLRNLGMKDLSGSIDVGISYTGQLGDVVMAAGSVDQSGTYVFEVEPQALGSTHRKLGSYWDLEDGSNTMYSLWNPTDKPQDVLVTLYYSGGSGKYKLPLHLAPQASVILDIKNIVEANAPDADGNTFPADAREGSASFDSPAPAGQITLIISGAVFNVVTGTCFGCCVPCCGTTDVFLDPSSDACTLGDSEQFTAMAEQCDGSSFATGGTWSSSNTSVMTVNSSGLMSTVGVGSATLAFIGNLPANADCGYPLPGECPPTNFQDSAPVNVDDFTVSNAQTIQDGATGNFSVTIAQGSSTPSSYKWSFSVPVQGAGNNPNVNFTSSTASQTGTDGHWYAFPNASCPNADQAGAPARISPYTVNAAVTFQDGNTVQHATTLNVNFIWFATGRTGQADITGSPAMAPDQQGVWHITGMGNMARVLPVNGVLVPQSSQFYNKSFQHEQVHVNQWVPPNGLVSDLYIPSVLFSQVQNFTGTSQADLQNQFDTAKGSYFTAQVNIFGKRKNALEQQAYAVSDPIPPQYMIQLCDRTFN